MLPISTLVFDLGNTIVQIAPRFNDPMAEWEQVWTIPGVLETINNLRNHYQLVLVTNAVDSDAIQVRKALKRVELESYFNYIFTSKELGNRKPESAFFEAIEERIGKSGHTLIMIGNDYEVDILGAGKAGWHSAWFNPKGSACNGCLPLYDYEFQNMNDLPLLLGRSVLPDWDTCTTWLMEQRVTRDLFLHVQCVGAVAYQMAVWLRAKGVAVDPLLAHRGGLLHDLAKFTATSPDLDHAAMAGDILEQHGQVELAEIVRRHVIIEDRFPVTWEQKLVFLADKLVDGSMVAGIDIRLKKLRHRYPAHGEKIERMTPVLMDVQASVCQRLNISPDDLIQRLRSG